MAHRSAASRHSAAAEPNQLPRLVHNSGPRSTQLPAASSRLFLLPAPAAGPRLATGRKTYRRLFALLHLILPHMPVI